MPREHHLRGFWVERGFVLEPFLLLLSPAGLLPQSRFPSLWLLSLANLSPQAPGKEKEVSLLCVPAYPLSAAPRQQVCCESMGETQPLKIQ